MNPPPDPTPNPNLPVPVTQAAQPLEVVPEASDVEELMKAHRTLAGVFKAVLKPHVREIVGASLKPNFEAAEYRLDRFFRPWPKWVFRLAAEVWHVQCPTIPKEAFIQTLRLLHVCMFHRLTTSQNDIRSPDWSKVGDRFDFRVLPFIHSAFLGHALEHIKAEQAELDKLRAAGLISDKDYAERISVMSPERVEEMLKRCFSAWSQDEGVSLTELIKTFENARAKTFDKNGALKQTQLTPIYRAMLYNWMTVERMSGPKELSNFLTPYLKGKSKSATGEQARIATLCSRLGVKFRGKSRTIDLQR